MSEQIYTKLKLSLVFLPLLGIIIWLSLNVQALGVRIGQPEVELDYVVGLLWWGVFALGILLLGGDSRRMLIIAWIGKFFVILVFMLFYEQSYGLDAYTYYEVAETGEHWIYREVDFREDKIPRLKAIYTMNTGHIIKDPYIEPESSFGTLGTENTIRFAMLISSLTGPFYHGMKVAFALLGLLGVWAFYRAVVVALGRPCPGVFYLLAFFPSIMFWSSIVGKDPLLFFFLGVYAYGGVLWFSKGRPIALWWLMIGLCGCYMLRPWISLMAGGVLFIATVLGRVRAWQAGLSLAMLPILFLVTSSLMGQWMGGLSLRQDILLDTVGALAQGYQDRGSGAQGIDLTSREAIAENYPLAMFSGIFRPLPFDVRNPFTALAAIENTAVLLLSLVALIRFRLSFLRDPLVLWPLLFTLAWTAMYGFIVLMNFGAGVRFKLQMWPFFLMLLVVLTHHKGLALLTSRLRGK